MNLNLTLCDLKLRDTLQLLSNQMTYQYLNFFQFLRGKGKLIFEQDLLTYNVHLSSWQTPFPYILEFVQSFIFFLKLKAAPYFSSSRHRSNCVHVHTLHGEICMRTYIFLPEGTHALQSTGALWRASYTHYAQLWLNIVLAFALSRLLFSRCRLRPGWRQY